MNESIPIWNSGFEQIRESFSYFWKKTNLGNFCCFLFDTSWGWVLKVLMIDLRKNLMRSFLSYGSIAWLLAYALNSVYVFHIQLKKTPNNKKNKNKEQHKFHRIDEVQTRYLPVLSRNSHEHLVLMPKFCRKIQGKILFSLLQRFEQEKQPS